MRKPQHSEDKKYALLIADMLNDFVQEGSTLEVPAARSIINNLKREITKARRKNIPIIFCCDAHKKNDPEFQLWPPHAVKGTKGSHVIDQLKPHKDDFVVTKTHYSCFYKTSLAKLLKSLGVAHVIVTGVVTNICVLYTVAEAYMRGYEITVPKDCVAGLTLNDHQFALEQMERLFHVKIT